MAPLHTFFFTCSEELARPPLGIESINKHQDDTTAADPFDPAAPSQRHAACQRAAHRAYAACDARQREQLEVEGAVAAVFERSPYCHGVVRAGVAAVFAGEIAAWPGHDQVAEHHDSFVRGEPLAADDDADWLIEFFESFSSDGATSEDVTDAALRCLSEVQGSFAFVVYDSATRRVWAARDAAGAQPLFWGVTEDNRLAFSTHADKLEGCTPSATPFPAGTLFASRDATQCASPGPRGWVIRGEHPLPGSLLSFVASSGGSAAAEAAAPQPHHPSSPKWRKVKAVPRLDAEGHICGAVYRVASERGLAAPS